jgi:hypothetical protein
MRRRARCAVRLERAARSACRPTRRGRRCRSHSALNFLGRNGEGLVGGIAAYHFDQAAGHALQLLHQERVVHADHVDALAARERVAVVDQDDVARAQIRLHAVALDVDQPKVGGRDAQLAANPVLLERQLVRHVLSV